MSFDINSVVLRPDRYVIDRPDRFGLAFRTIEAINQAGHRIAGWLMLPAGEPTGVIVVSHGNAGNVGVFLPWARMLVGAGYAAVLYDYQGYGDSEGQANINSLVGDGRAVLEWLFAHGVVQRERTDQLGLLGLSLGTLVSIKLAGEFSQVAAVVLEGAMIPADELKRKFGVLGAPVAWLLCRQIPDELDSARCVRDVRCPVLFVQAGEDEVTSTEGARQLFELANAPKEYVEAPGRRHLRPLFDWPDYAQVVRGWFGRFIGGPGRRQLESGR